MDQAVREELTLRAGFQIDPTPTPAIGRSQRVPDADRTITISARVSRRPGALTLSAAAGYTDFEDDSIVRPSNSTAAPRRADTSRPVAGDRQRAIVVSFGGRMRF